MLVLACIAAAGLLSLRQYRTEVRGEIAEHLRSIVEARASEIAHWREERLSAGRSLAGHPLVARAAREAARGSTAARAELLAWCASRLEREEYAAVVVFGADGAPLVAAGPEKASALQEARLAPVTGERSVTMSDLHADAGDSPHLDLVAPLLPTGGTPIAHVLLRIEPAGHLALVLQSWSERTSANRVVLVQRTGAGASVFGSTHPGTSATAFGPVPLDRRELVVARAARGEQGALEGVDAREARVLASAVQVPGTHWTVVAQTAASSLDRPVRARALWLAALGAALAVIVGAGAHLWWWRQLDSFRRHQREHELRQLALERHFAYLTQHANDMLMLLGGDLRIAEVNDRCVAAYGYERDELLGRHVRDVLAPRARAGLAARFAALEAGEAQRFETSHVRRDGTTFPVEVSARVIEVEGERYFQAVVRDITERKQAERTIRDNEERLELALETSGLGIWDLAVERDEVHVSPRFLEMLGYPAGELRSGEAIRGLVHPDDRAAAKKRWTALLDGTVPLFEAEMRLRARTGEWRCVLNRARVIRRGGGGGTRVIGTLSDLTERKTIQARLELTDRIASLGVLAAGVAHEIASPLASLASGLELARGSIARVTAASALAPVLGAGERDAPGSVTALLGEARLALDDAQRACDRLRAVASDLTSFSGSDDATRPLDVPEVVGSAVGLARATLQARARLSLGLSPVPPVEASATRLRQVFLNILLNAAQSIPEGAADGNEIRVATTVDASGRVVVEIRDTGCGMRPDVQARIFDPFFTTRPAGAGLGLWICHGIVTGLGGEVRVESEPGKGTAFQVLLPPAEAAATSGPSVGA
ncbi:MAG TPA: PAS domain S-box protein [Anaeromyxobacter sp.]